MLIQWGKVNIRNISYIGDQNTFLTINFPIAFTTTNYYIKTSIVNTAGSYQADYDFQIYSTYHNQVSLLGQALNNDTVSYREAVEYIVIGY